MRRRLFRVSLVPIALSLAFCSTRATYSPKRMADGKQWTTRNLDLNIAPSYWHDNAKQNCLPVWPSVHVGVGAASMPSIRR